MATPRLIPDSECKQGKCGSTTTGCWDECTMKRFPLVYTTSQSTLAQQVAQAQSEVASWSPELRVSVRLEGGDIAPEQATPELPLARSLLLTNSVPISLPQ